MSGSIYAGDRRVAIKRRLLGVVPASQRLRAKYWAERVLGRSEQELARLRELAEGPRALDIGANHGVYSYALSRMVPKVEAFEPQPWCADTLRLARLKGVAVHGCALSDSEGELELVVPVIGGHLYTQYARLADPVEDGVEVRRFPVPVRRLDDFGFRDVGFVKIDVEGFEDSVLRGAAETIAATTPNMLIEVDGRLTPCTAEERIAEICAYGYEAFFLREGRWTHVSEFDSARDQRTCEEDGRSVEFVQNFAFVPAGRAARLLSG